MFYRYIIAYILAHVKHVPRTLGCHSHTRDSCLKHKGLVILVGLVVREV